MPSFRPESGAMICGVVPVTSSAASSRWSRTRPCRPCRRHRHRTSPLSSPPLQAASTRRAAPNALHHRADSTPYARHPHIGVKLDARRCVLTSWDHAPIAAAVALGRRAPQPGRAGPGARARSTAQSPASNVAIRCYGAAPARHGSHPLPPAPRLPPRAASTTATPYDLAVMTRARDDARRARPRWSISRHAGRCRAHARSSPSSFACLGLVPAGSDGGSSSRSPMTATRPRTCSVTSRAADESGDIIAVGAHHDHLGGGLPRRERQRVGRRRAARDRAGRPAARDPPKRTIVFATFGAEERGMRGSYHFVAHPPDALPLARIVQVINLDMVGSHASRGFVAAMGTFRGLAATGVLARARRRLSEAERRTRRRRARLGPRAVLQAGHPVRVLLDARQALLPPELRHGRPHRLSADGRHRGARGRPDRGARRLRSRPRRACARAAAAVSDHTVGVVLRRQSRLMDSTDPTAVIRWEVGQPSGVPGESPGLTVARAGGQTRPEGIRAQTIHYCFTCLMSRLGACNETHGGNQPIGGDVDTEAEIQRYLRRAYLDLTGSGPSDAELAASTTRLHDGRQHVGGARRARRRAARQVEFSTVWVEELENAIFGGNSISSSTTTSCARSSRPDPACKSCTLTDSCACPCPPIVPLTPSARSSD